MSLLSEYKQKVYKSNKTNKNMANTNVAGKTVLLIIVLILIGYLYLGNPNFDLGKNTLENKANELELSNNLVLQEVSKNVSKPTNRQIVTDRFTQKIDENGVVVVVDGSNAYAVRKGVVIVDDNIIRVNEEEYTVDFTENPRRIVSSN